MRRLWQVLGEYDALVEYIELTTRMFKTSFESQHELTFPEFLSSEAMKENICLNDLTLDNYETFKYNLKSASNLNGNLNCSKELEHYAS